MIVRLDKGRIAFYVGCFLLMAVVYANETYMQRPQAQVLGVLSSSDTPSPPPADAALNKVEQAQLTAFLDVNQLITTLGTTMLGALGYFLTTRKGKAKRGGLWAAVASFVCVGLSIYFGYHAYLDVIAILQKIDQVQKSASIAQLSGSTNVFDLSSGLVGVDRELHFGLFLLGVFFFADFAFHELNQKEPEQKDAKQEEPKHAATA